MALEGQSCAAGISPKNLRFAWRFDHAHPQAYAHAAAEPTRIDRRPQIAQVRDRRSARAAGGYMSMPPLTGHTAPVM